MLQRTIKESVSIEGISIHSGEKAKITFKPAPSSSGITFIRADLEGAPKIEAVVSNVCSTKRGTSLKKGAAEVSVVEHILAALSGLGIDNIRIELSGPEPPNLDGSALPYVELLKQAEIVELKQEKRIIELKKKVTVEKNGSSIEARPYDGFKVDFMVNFKDTTIEPQSFIFEEKQASFEREIAGARTYGFVEEIEKLKSQGLAKGASLENALALNNNGFVNPPRWKDEPVRHKILDLIGDLSLLGAKLKAEIIARKSGHALNIELVKEINKLVAKD